MISLPFLWQWLYSNFAALPDDSDEEGIAKEEVVRELLATKDVNKEGNEQAAAFAKALIGRYLCVLFKTSEHVKHRFTNPRKPDNYSIRKLEGEEKASKEAAVPPFPADLRALILKELREERLGRTSAKNLLRLMTQPPKKKVRTSDGSGASLSPTQGEKGMPPPAGDVAGEEGMEVGGSPPESPTRRGTKRSAPDAGKEAGSPASGTRGLKRQASSPAGIAQKTAAGASSTAAQGPLFSQQEPWKREINDLWAKQLAMMREINTLKVELGRREAARQREILAMRQELDVMRGEIFRLRQLTGVAAATATLNPLDAEADTTQETASAKAESGEELGAEERPTAATLDDKIVAASDVPHSVAEQ